MSPFGPRMRPSLTSCGIMSGVARHAVKSIDLPLLSRMELTSSDDPTTSAPAGNKARVQTVAVLASSQGVCVHKGKLSKLAAMTGDGMSRVRNTRKQCIAESCPGRQSGKAAQQRCWIRHRPTCCPCFVGRCSLSKHCDAQPRLPAVGQHCRTTHHLVATPGVNLEPHVGLYGVRAARSALHAAQE
jgi:hypothetical protein